MCRDTPRVIAMKAVCLKECSCFAISFESVSDTTSVVAPRGDTPKTAFCLLLDKFVMIPIKKLLDLGRKSKEEHTNGMNLRLIGL